MDRAVRWRFLDSGKGSAVFHMAVDEALVRAVESEMSPPTLRFFEWDGPAVTVGHFQRMKEVLDLGRCARDGVETAKRPTGGRALFHERDLGYSIIGRLDDPLFGRTIGDSCRVVGSALADALRGFGLEASFGGPEDRALDAGFGIGPAPCLLSATRHELAWRGRKIAGGAQRRFGGVFLHQGVLLAAPGFERIAEYLRAGSAGPDVVERIRSRAVDLETILGGPVDVVHLKRAIRESFERAFGGKMSDCAFAPAEFFYGGRAPMAEPCGTGERRTCP